MSETQTDKNEETQQNQGVSDKKTNLKDTKKQPAKKNILNKEKIDEPKRKKNATKTTKKEKAKSTSKKKTTKVSKPIAASVESKEQTTETKATDTVQIDETE